MDDKLFSDDKILWRFNYEGSGDNSHGAKITKPDGSDVDSPDIDPLVEGLCDQISDILSPHDVFYDMDGGELELTAYKGGFARLIRYENQQINDEIPVPEKVNISNVDTQSIGDFLLYLAKKGGSITLSIHSFGAEKGIDEISLSKQDKPFSHVSSPDVINDVLNNFTPSCEDPSLEYCYSSALHAIFPLWDFGEEDCYGEIKVTLDKIDGNLCLRCDGHLSEDWLSCKDIEQIDFCCLSEVDEKLKAISSLIRKVTYNLYGDTEFLNEKKVDNEIGIGN